MNDQQIRKLVLSMDEDMRLGKDMVEQVSHYCKDVAALKYFLCTASQICANEIRSRSGIFSKEVESFLELLLHLF